jgi:thiol-disulfide isomerase/thioredoxin
MMTRRRWLAAGTCLAALRGSLDAEEPPLAALLKALDLRVYPVGSAPPPFAGRTLDGQLSIADLRGKVVLLNFWATWCAECRPEMPALERLHREFGSRGLTVVGINAREPAPVVRRYASELGLTFPLSELGLTFPLVLDTDGVLTTRYGVVGLPATFVVGRDGRAVAFAVGGRTWDGAAARTLIAALLAEPGAR